MSASVMKTLLKRAKTKRHIFRGSARAHEFSGTALVKREQLVMDQTQYQEKIWTVEVVKSRKLKQGLQMFLLSSKAKEQSRSCATRQMILHFKINILGGICFSLFLSAFNLATNDQWHTLNDGVLHLCVYTAFFYFSCSCFVIAIILNVTLLYRPAFNLPRSSFKAYLNEWDGRGWAFLASFLCGFGIGLQFMGSQAAGYAAAGAFQALPLVSTFWGVLIFGEYHKSSRRTYVILAGMLSMFIVAVGVF